MCMYNIMYICKWEQCSKPKAMLGHSSPERMSRSRNAKQNEEEKYNNNNNNTESPSCLSRYYVTMKTSADQHVKTQR